MNIPRLMTARPESLPSGILNPLEEADCITKKLQARPNKIRLKSKDEESLEAKLLAKATIITESANRLWRKLWISRPLTCSVVSCHTYRD